MEIAKLVFNVDYKGSLFASVDWIAGGNFDGYIIRNSIRFIKENNIVIRTQTVVDKSRYDDDINSSEISGTYFESGHATISCVFEKFEMRGKILGDKNQFIAFSLYSRENNISRTECYELV